MFGDSPEKKIKKLERENQLLKERLDNLQQNRRGARRRSLRYMLSKKAAYLIIGKGLKNSLIQLYTELPHGVKKDTFADVSAHLVWRLTRIGVFAVIIGVVPLLILLTQTIILSQQNKLLSSQNELFRLQVEQVNNQNNLIDGQNQLFREQNKLFESQNEKVDVQNDLVKGQNRLVTAQNGLFDNQNSLVAKQNQRIEQQTELIEADRRSSLVFLMGNIMDRLDSELKSESNDKRALSLELIGQISALSQSLKPYRYLKNDRLIKKPLSPERGQLLLSLINSRLDTAETYKNIYISTKFSRADLDEAFLRGAYMHGAILTNAVLDEADLNNAILSEAYLREADLKEIYATNSDFRDADLSEAELNLADLRRSNLTRANLNEAELDKAELNSAILTDASLKNAILIDADLSETNLIRANFKEADLRKVDLTFAIVDSKKWFKKLEKWKVKGLEDIREKYSLEPIKNDDGDIAHYLLVPKG
ncbi:MAG: pentapeptide repeat-containing protein [Bacteroidota bacterium]